MRSIQDIQFELMERASFNDFDGTAVVQSLRENSGLWRGATMLCGAYAKKTEYGNRVQCSLIALRDIHDGYWNVDTLYLMPMKGCEYKLYTLALKWQADEVDWEDTWDCGRVLRVWWD